MTTALQVSFVLAGLLMWAGVGIIAVNLRHLRRGKTVRELPTPVAVQAAALFILAALATSVFTRQLGSENLSDFVLFTVVFTSASVVLAWLADTGRALSRPAFSVNVKRLASYGVPLSAGVLVGIVGVV